MITSQHDAECEAELTSHGYTNCRCQDRMKKFSQLDMGMATKPLHVKIERLIEALNTIYTTTRESEVSECCSARKYLDKYDIFNDDIGGRRRLVVEVCKHALGIK